MKFRKSLRPYIFLLVLFFSISACSKEEQGDTILKGTVTSLVDGEPVFPAYLILDNKLLATTGEDGSYEITSLDPGIYSLLCSAIDYADNIVQVELSLGDALTKDFDLAGDDRMGRIYGEFHDKEIYLEKLVSNPEMESWTGQELFDGVSGATIFTSFDEPSGEISVGDSLFAYADGYGQFWFDIQCGTYPVRGFVSGYRDSSLVIQIEPDREVYSNYMLLKQK